MLPQNLLSIKINHTISRQWIIAVAIKVFALFLRHHQRGYTPNTFNE